MKTSIKKRITFRLDSDLLDDLKIAAKREHQSLNNFVETQLMQFMYTELNEETRAAIAESRNKENGKVYDSADDLMEDLMK
jgi:uncharacterized protein (DUF1778 family)